MKNVLLYVQVLGLIFSGVAAIQERKPLRCKNPAGKLWSSILNRNCGQSVCKKTGNKAMWKECPKAATEEILKEGNENQTKKLDEKIENQTKKLYEKIEKEKPKPDNIPEFSPLKID